MANGERTVDPDVSPSEKAEQTRTRVPDGSAAITMMLLVMTVIVAFMVMLTTRRFNVLMMLT